MCFPNCSLQFCEYLASREADRVTGGGEIADLQATSWLIIGLNSIAWRNHHFTAPSHLNVAPLDLYSDLIEL